MPFDIIKIEDRVKLTAKEAEDIIKAHIAGRLDRDVNGIEFHMGRGELGAVTVYLKDEG